MPRNGGKTSSFTGSLELNTRTQRKMPPVFYSFVVPNLAAWNFKRTTKMFQSLSPPNTIRSNAHLLHGSLGTSLTNRSFQRYKPIEFWSVMMQHSDTSDWWGDPTYRQPIGFTMGWELPCKGKKTFNHWESGSTMICKTPSHWQFTTSQHQVSTGCFASFRMKFEEIVCWASSWRTWIR